MLLSSLSRCQPSSDDDSVGGGELRNVTADGVAELISKGALEEA